MRDIKLISSNDGEYDLDVSIVNGRFSFVSNSEQTQDQRAAVASYTIRGTIPGMPEEGIPWSGLYSGTDDTLVSIDNAVKQALQEKAAIQGSIGAMYIPVYITDEETGGTKIQIFRS